jgi:hypothetical protein
LALWAASRLEPSREKNAQLYVIDLSSQSAKKSFDTS